MFILTMLYGYSVIVDDNVMLITQLSSRALASSEVSGRSRAQLGRDRNCDDHNIDGISE